MKWEDSGPPLSESGPPSSEGGAEDDAQFPVGDGPRYERRGLLGIGGMGKVYVAWDRVLRREVALKEASTPKLARRLAREAWITAQLEHPGIVAVYDAGTVGGERPWYSMRMVRGRTLHERIEGCADLAARLVLVSRFYAACQAVAFAHSMGVVHRDLKPANVMVGQFGETQIVDWGLAQPVADASEAWARIAPGEAHAAAGTVRYMSPEQMDGAPASRTSDVWSLGISLGELLGDDPEVPPELAAIAARATRVDPADRYPSAAELCGDLERWLAGRRVHAYHYSAGELFVRLVKAWKAPLLVGGIALLALVLTLAVGAQRTAAERTAAEQYLLRSLTEQAVTALSDDRRPAAEILAAHALMLGPSPKARGVLTATAGPRPRRLTTIALPDICQRGSVLSPDGSQVACHSGDGLEVWELSPLALRWSLPARLTAGPVFDGGWLVQIGEEVQRLSSETGAVQDRWTVSMPLTLFPGPVGFAPGVWTVMPPRQPVRTFQTCGMSRAAATVHGPLMVTACEDAFEIRDASGALVHEWRLPAPRSWSTLASAGDWVLAGTFDGGVTRLDPRTGDVEPMLDGFGGPVLQLVAVPETSLVVALGESGAPRIWNTDMSTWVGTLPGNIRQVFGGVGDGEVALAGEAMSRWRLPGSLRPTSISVGAGVSNIAVSPDGSQIAYALGTGVVGLRSVEDGALAQTWKWQDAVAKCVAFFPDGVSPEPSFQQAALLASGMDGGWRLLGRDGGIANLGPQRPLRRVGTLAHGVWGLPYRGSVMHFGDGGVREFGGARDLGDEMYEGSSSPSGDLAVIVTDSGGVFLFNGATMERVGTHLDVIAADIGDGGDPLVLAERFRLCIDGSCIELEDSIVDVAVSDGLVAVGTLAGDIHLYDLETHEVVAVLQGHTSRAASVEFGPGWVASGSWDGSLRVWDLSVLDTPAAALVAERELAWGMDLDQALQSR
jgi:WD40 repeat protein